jgi:hypothetical protein
MAILCIFSRWRIAGNGQGFGVVGRDDRLVVAQYADSARVDVGAGRTLCWVIGR